jgi:hypothetical protein
MTPTEHPNTFLIRRDSYHGVTERDRNTIRWTYRDMRKYHAMTRETARRITVTLILAARGIDHIDWDDAK